MVDIVQEHYKRHFNNLTKRYMRALGGIHASEDVVQDAYERALRYWAAFEESEEFENWFSLILKNAFRDALRKEKGEFVDIESIPEESISCGMGARITERDLRDFIGRMHPDHQEILDLYLFKGFFPREIEMLTEFSGSKINKTIHRFRKEMIRELKM